jgi:hypothetical protein
LLKSQNLTRAQEHANWFLQPSKADANMIVGLSHRSKEQTMALFPEHETKKY